MSSPSARWEEIRALFEDVVEVDATRRMERLERIGARDPQLRASVEALLSMDDIPGDPLQQLIGTAAGDLMEHQADRLIGERIGPYQITAVLGYGGTSTVYSARRVDALSGQLVAIKVLHHATIHPHLRSRLHSERHVMARLEHPGIARLIDSGDLPDGSPYIVLEHVAGEDVLNYCDNRALFVRERVELFIRICEAVQFAHRNLIVHRDLKPGNILVTPEGNPKLLDFGIAKLLAPANLSHTLPVTRLQERVLTPENAAPEQVLGRPITTATDIYALGVLLYQLLSGRPPYRLASYSQLQLERAICMDDPPRVSQAAGAVITGEADAGRQRISERRRMSPDRLRACLAGDLDAIVAMAMRKEPERRYASAQALADDLGRYLRAEPVLARQGDWRYGAGKFLRRHLLAVAGTTAMIMGLAGLAVITLWQNQRIEQSRLAAVRERDRAQQVSGFLVDVFSQADPFNAQGHETSARELLDRGASRIMDDLDEQPEVRAELLESIGLAYRRQGLGVRAVPLFEQAVAIRRAMKPSDPARIAVAQANLAEALADAGQLASAEKQLHSALALSKSASPSARRQTADILMQLGRLALDGRSQTAQATGYFQQALAVYTNALGPEATEVGTAQIRLGEVAAWRDDYADAERYYREGLAIYRKTLSRNHPDFAVALANLGFVLVEHGKYAEAGPMLNEALDIEKRVFGPENQRVAETLEHQARLHERRGELPLAIDTLLQSIAISRKRLGNDHYLVGYRLDYLASLYLESHDLPAAEGQAREALRIYARSLPAEHLYVASTRQLLGDILIARGRYQGATVELTAAAGLSRRLAGADSWRTARANASLGWARINSGDDAAGALLLIDSQRRLEQLLGDRNPATQRASRYLVAYYRLHHRDADAARVLAALDSR